MKTDEPSATFVEAVRHALMHLYDPEVLVRSGLRQWLGMGDQMGAPELRRAVLSALDSLKPGSEVRSDVKAWRPYRALYHRHVEQFTQREVATALSLSVRQIRREEALAVNRLAEALWTRYGVGEKRQRPREETGVGEPRLPRSGPAQAKELLWLQHSSELESLDVSAMIDSAIDVVEPLARQLAVSLTWNCPTGAPRVMARALGIRQALINVLAMALRLTPGGSVDVSVVHETKQVQIQVTFEGPSEVRALAPEGGDETLQIVRELLDLSGGSVHSEESADQTAGTLILGLQADERTRLLCVDDNADALLLVKRYLDNSPFRYFGTRDPGLALTLAEEIQPAAILLDVMLPGIDGWELLGRLRANPGTSSIPILVYTIMSEEGLALSLGAAGFLRKPVSRTALLAALARHASTEPRTPQ